ncbi:unnamed protein product, partial [Strongylus vulgaris]
AGFLQRDVATTDGTPTSPKLTRGEVLDRERSKSLQDSYKGLCCRQLTDSCPSIKDDTSLILPLMKEVLSPVPKRSLPCMSLMKETRLNVQIYRRRRCLPQTPVSDSELDDNEHDNRQAELKRQQFRRTVNNSIDLGNLHK